MFSETIIEQNLLTYIRMKSPHCSYKKCLSFSKCEVGRKLKNILSKSFLPDLKSMRWSFLFQLSRCYRLLDPCIFLPSEGVPYTTSTTYTATHSNNYIPKIDRAFYTHITDRRVQLMVFGAFGVIENNPIILVLRAGYENLEVT